MIMILILFFLVLALCFAIFKYQKANIVVSVFTLFIFLLVGSGIVPYLLLKPLESFNALSKPLVWAKRNAIVVLGSGTIKVKDTNDIIPTAMSYSRMYEGAKRYFECKKTNSVCILILSGGDAGHNGLSEAEAYKKALLQVHVNEADIKIEPQSMNTFQNAKYSSALIKKEKLGRVYLVTSGTHLKRALIYFSYFNIDAYPIAADYIMPKISVLPLANNFTMTDCALHEYLGIAQFHLYNALGWNR